MATSLAQCLSSYMRASPGTDANAYASGPTTHAALLEWRCVSAVIAAAVAKLAAA
jgi:hypothetical protein